MYQLCGGYAAAHSSTAEIVAQSSGRSRLYQFVREYNVVYRLVAFAVSQIGTSPAAQTGKANAPITVGAQTVSVPPQALSSQANGSNAASVTASTSIALSSEPNP